MKIKILKCSDSRLWYNKHIGKEFDVHYKTKEGQQILYWVKEVSDYGALNIVKSTDCEELNVNTEN